jgi:hypothetical protein
MKVAADMSKMAARGELVFNVVRLEQSILFEVVRAKKQDDGKVSLLVALNSYDKTDGDWNKTRVMVEQGVRGTIEEELPSTAGKIGNIEFLLRSPPPPMRSFCIDDQVREIIKMMQSTHASPSSALIVLNEAARHIHMSIHADEEDDDDGDEDGPRPPERRRPFRTSRSNDKFDGVDGFGR